MHILNYIHLKIEKFKKLETKSAEDNEVITPLISELKTVQKAKEARRSLEAMTAALSSQHIRGMSLAPPMSMPYIIIRHPSVPHSAKIN